MSGGIEVAGLVLGLFPVVMQLVQLARSDPAPPEIRSLQRTIKTQHTIFLNCLEGLISPHIDGDDFQELINDPGGAKWNDPKFNAKIKEPLGEDEYLNLMEVISDINVHLTKLKEVLESNGKEKKSLKKKLKWLRSRLEHMHEIEQLKERMSELQQLISEETKVRSRVRKRRKANSATQVFHKFRKYAAAIYRALSRGWRCQCAQHQASLRLEHSVSLLQGRSPSGEKRALQFRLSLSFTNQDGKGAVNWYEAELIPLDEDEPQVSTPERIGEKTVPERKVKFDIASPKSADTAAIPDGTPPIQDLCRFIRENIDDDGQSGQIIGYIVDEAGSRYGLRNVVQAHTDGPSPAYVKLTKMLAEGFPTLPSDLRLHSNYMKFDLADRLWLACTLSAMVLKLHSTPWLEDPWIRKDIIFLETCRDSVHSAIVPYVSHNFVRRRDKARQSTELGQEQACDYAMSPTLFTLGIVLIEIGLRKPIEMLARELLSPQDAPDTVNYSARQLLTAQKVLKTKELHRNICVRYQQVVRSCIHCDELGDGDLNDEEVQYKFFQVVVTVLDEIRRDFGRRGVADF